MGRVADGGEAVKLTYSMQSLSISSETRGNYLLTVFGRDGLYTYYVDDLVLRKRVVTCRRSYKTFRGCQKAGRAALERLA